MEKLGETQGAGQILMSTRCSLNTALCFTPSLFAIVRSGTRDCARNGNHSRNRLVSRYDHSRQYLTLTIAFWVPYTTLLSTPNTARVYTFHGSNCLCKTSTGVTTMGHRSQRPSKYTGKLERQVASQTS